MTMHPTLSSAALICSWFEKHLMIMCCDSEVTVNDFADFSTWPKLCICFSGGQMTLPASSLANAPQAFLHWPLPPWTAMDTGHMAARIKQKLRGGICCVETCTKKSTWYARPDHNITAHYRSNRGQCRSAGQLHQVGSGAMPSTNQIWPSNGTTHVHHPFSLLHNSGDTKTCACHQPMRCSAHACLHGGQG